MRGGEVVKLCWDWLSENYGGGGTCLRIHILLTGDSYMEYS